MVTQDVDETFHPPLLSLPCSTLSSRCRHNQCHDVITRTFIFFVLFALVSIKHKRLCTLIWASKRQSASAQSPWLLKTLKPIIASETYYLLHRLHTKTIHPQKVFFICYANVQGNLSHHTKYVIENPPAQNFHTSRKVSSLSIKINFFRDLSTSLYHFCCGLL